LQINVRLWNEGEKPEEKEPKIEETENKPKIEKGCVF
jgi:hypothetical protein